MQGGPCSPPTSAAAKPKPMMASLAFTPLVSVWGSYVDLLPLVALPIFLWPLLAFSCLFVLAASVVYLLVHGSLSVELYTMSRSTDRSATGDCPSLPWRALSATTIFGVAALCRSFLFMCSRPEINGLDSFLELLESRQDRSRRTRGLLTGIDPLYSTNILCLCLIAARTSIADMGLIRQSRTI